METKDTYNYPATVNGLSPFRFSFTLRGREVSGVRYYVNQEAAKLDVPLMLSGEYAWRKAKGVVVVPVITQTKNLPK